MGSETSNQFVNDGGGGGLDFKGFVDGTGKLFIADTEFEFGFLFHGKFFWEEVGEDFGCFSRVGVVNDVEGNSGGFEGEEVFEVGNLTEGFEVGDLGLDGVDGGVDFIELLKFEESVAEGTFVENVEYHE